MLQYEEAMARALGQQRNKEARTIPEEMFSIHPKQLYAEMPELLMDCECMQKQVLQEILLCAQGSAYAREHDFRRFTSLEEWRDHAAVTTYEDYRPYIERELAGEPRQLYTGETALFIATTGSTGNIKYFLESKAGNTAKQLVMSVRGMYMSELLPVTLDMDAKNLTISNYAPVDNSADGKLVVRASGQTARNMRKKTGTMNLLPVEFWEAPGIAARDRDYMMAVYTLAEVRFSKVFCNNLIHFGRILDRIVAEGQQMIEDIRHGDFSVELLPEVREQLRRLFPANTQRADGLQELYDKKGCLITGPEDIATIWPALSMVSCWLSASVGRDAREVLRRLPAGIKCFEMGYGASECKLNIPNELASASGIAAPFACFFEFCPLDGGAPLCMWEVTDGVCYELLVTTYSGLYRYNLQDIVRIQGFTGNTPNIVFCGKSSEFVQIDGEKIYGHQFADLIRQIEKKRSCNFDLMQIYKNTEGFFYVLESKDAVDYTALKQELDEQTERLWGIISSGIYVVKQSYKDYQFTVRTREDRGACGIKLPLVISEEPLDSEIEMRI